MELERIQQTGQATGVYRKELLRPGVAILILVAIIPCACARGEVSPLLAIAGMMPS